MLNSFSETLCGNNNTQCQNNVEFATIFSAIVIAAPTIMGTFYSISVNFINYLTTATEVNKDQKLKLLTLNKELGLDNKPYLSSYINSLLESNTKKSTIISFLEKYKSIISELPNDDYKNLSAKEHPFSSFTKEVEAIAERKSTKAYIGMSK